MTNDDYVAANKQAFRVPYDILTRFWPPKQDADFFKDAYAVCAVAYNDTLKENKMGREILLAVWDRLERVAKELHDETEISDQLSFETIVTTNANRAH